MVSKFFESFDEIFSLPSNKKILVDNAYLYARLHYKWFMGLDIIIKLDNPSLFKKLNELIYEPLRDDKFNTEFTVSQLKYIDKLLNLEFVPTCFKKTDSDILCEERKQLSYKSKIFKKFQSILYKYEDLEFSKKNEQSLVDEIKNSCLHFSK
jgi:hypothetical protein